MKLWQYKYQMQPSTSRARWLHLHSLTEVAEVIKTVLTNYYKTSQAVSCGPFLHIWWNRGRLSFFPSLSPAADRYSAASPSGCLGLDQHSCRGSRISPVFVSHSSRPWPLLFSLRSSSTSQPQEQIQDSSGHEGTSSVVIPLSAFPHPTSERPVGAALRLGAAGQTERGLCRSSECTNMSPSESIPILLCLYRKPGSHVGSINFYDKEAFLHPHTQDSSVDGFK